MPLTLDDVAKVALLSRLQLAPDELARMTDQLSHIVGYVELLGELNTDSVEPMAHAIDLANVFGDDVPRPSPAREAMLANAPHHDQECYLVPAVLGD